MASSTLSHLEEHQKIQGNLLTPQEEMNKQSSHLNLQESTEQGFLFSSEKTGVETRITGHQTNPGRRLQQCTKGVQRGLPSLALGPAATSPSPVDQTSHCRSHSNGICRFLNNPLLFQGAGLVIVSSKQYIFSLCFLTKS